MTPLRSDPTPRRRFTGPRIAAAALAASFAASFAAGPMLAVAAPTRATGLSASIDRVIRDAKLRGTATAVSVREIGGGELAAIRSDEAMIPASNMKLLTSGVALRELGPEFRFHTRLLRSGGRLVIAGDGDPAFGDPDLLAATVFRNASGELREGLGVEDLLSLWVESVRRSGEAIEEIVVDDRVFDRERTHPGWPADQLDRHYCAEVAGVNFHLNCIDLRIEPVRGGGPATVREMIPNAPWLPIENRSTSRRGGDAKHSLAVGRRPSGDGVTIAGNAATADAATVRLTVPEPALFFGRLLADRLSASGVTVGQVRLASLHERFDDAVEVAPPVQTPIATVLARSNRDSRNLHAEALLKRAAHARSGRPGSWEEGARLVEATIERALGSGVARTLAVSDGSGLSRGNRVSAALLTAWLADLHEDPATRGPFLESFAVAGRSGTIRTRFRHRDLRQCEVLAKTGYINGVSTLSGYAIAPNGRTLAFSILMNGVRALADARALQERIVEAIAREAAN
jgi:D-alanyl-D-alanine carboxypeptidase/D-alanyl-D-alanine-endopeptidase (penicillin-binding protein 4)